MLKIEHLRKTFNAGTINEKVIFSDFNLEVNDGDFITVIGSNGAGKSTLLNLISGSILPDGGKITLNGENITFLSDVHRSKHIGRVFQDPRMGTAADMWISENMALALRRGDRRSLKWGIAKGEELEFFKKQLARLGLGLENRTETKVGLLSGGQRQAITLLTATLKKPDLLLLDEHTAALDPKTAATVLDLSDKIVRENNLTTLMVTHNMQNAIDYGNRLVMLHSGKVIFDIRGEDKKKLTVSDLMEKFSSIGGALSDSAVLS